MLKTYGEKSLENYQGTNTNNFRIYINNIKSNRSLNIDTFLIDISLTGTLIIDGYYPYIEPNQLFVVGTEVVKMISYTTNKTEKKTELVVERAYNHCVRTDLLKGDIVCSVEEFTLKVNSYQYSNKMDLSNNPFSTYFGSGYVRITDEIKKWNMLSNVSEKYNYTNYKTKIFIFEGYEEKVILTFRGYLKKLSFSRTVSDKRQITLNMVDQLGSYWNKDLINKKFIKNKTIDEMLSDLFKIPKEKIYFKHIDKSRYPIIENLTIADYKNYSQIVELFANNGIRMFFTPRGHLHIFCEALDNDLLRTDTLLTDVENLTDISLSDDSQLVFNFANIDYKKQFPYYDLDKGVNYRYNMEVTITPILYMETGQYFTKEFDIVNTHLASKVSLDVYGRPSVCMIKDKLTGIEVICEPINIEGDRVTFVPIGLHNDTGLLEFGKGKYLYDLGFNVVRTWTIYYVQGNLPTVFALANTNAQNKSAKTNNLEIPITPIILNDDGTEFRNLNKKMKLQFGSPQNLKDLEYTNSYEGVDRIIGTWKGGIDLLYSKEWEQSQRGLDVFVNTSRLSRTGINSQQLPIYDTFDNSGFDLWLYNPSENDTEVNSQFINTLKRTVNLNDLPKISFNRGELIGDKASKSTQAIINAYVEPNDILFPVKLLTGYTPHERIKFEEMKAGGIEIRCVATSTYNGETVIHYNNPLFEHIEYAKISVKDIVYLQNYYIKLNPVVQSSHNFYYSNQESIDLYDGKKQFTLDRTIFNENYTRHLLSYVFNAYKGTDYESIKYVLPINTLKKLEYELYDLVKIKDKTVTDIDVNKLFLIIGKTVTFEGSRKIEYNLLNLYNKKVTLLDLNYSQVEKFNPLTDPTYNHSGIQQENDDIKVFDKRIEFFDGRLGKVIGKIIPPEKFRLHCLESINDVLLQVELRGEHLLAYKKSLFKNTLFETYLIVKIGEEYFYVSPYSYLENGNEKYRLQVLQRRLAKSQEEGTLVGKDIIVYLITEGSSKDGGLKSSSIYIGDGANGGYLTYDPYNGLRIVADSIEFVSGGKIGGGGVNEAQMKQLKKDIDDFKGNVQTLFTQQANKIELALKGTNLDGTQIVNRINLTPNGVLIQGNKIKIDGSTTFTNDVKIQGILESGKQIIVQGNGKQTIIGAGTIIFQEWSP